MWRFNCSLSFLFGWKQGAGISPPLDIAWLIVLSQRWILLTWELYVRKNMIGWFAHWDCTEGSSLLRNLAKMFFAAFTRRLEIHVESRSAMLSYLHTIRYYSNTHSCQRRRSAHRFQVITASVVDQADEGRTPNADAIEAEDLALEARKHSGCCIMSWQWAGPYTFVCLHVLRYHSLYCHDDIIGSKTGSEFNCL